MKVPKMKHVFIHQYSYLQNLHSRLLPRSYLSSINGIKMYKLEPTLKIAGAQKHMQQRSPATEEKAEPSDPIRT